MIKLIGAILITLCSGSVGIILSGRLKKRCIMLEKIISGINRIPEIMVTSKKDIPDILPLVMPAETDFSTLPPDIPDSTCLSKKDRELLLSFTSSVGASVEEEERRKCEGFVKLFDIQLKSAYTEYSEKHKLFSVGGFLVGAAVSLLLI